MFWPLLSSTTRPGGILGSTQQKTLAVVYDVANHIAGSGLAPRVAPETSLDSQTIMHGVDSEMEMSSVMSHLPEIYHI